jgi:hypothetical protein
MKMSTPSCFCVNGVLGCDDRNVTTYCDCALGQAKAELAELRECAIGEEQVVAPSFLSTKGLIAERKRCHHALECALDYVQHMATEDAELIRAAYRRDPFEVGKKS